MAKMDNSVGGKKWANSKNHLKKYYWGARRLDLKK